MAADGFAGTAAGAGDGTVGDGGGATAAVGAWVAADGAGTGPLSSGSRASLYHSVTIKEESSILLRLIVIGCKA